MKLTPKALDALPPASGKRYEVRDILLPGLVMRVSASGAKVWYLTTRLRGISKRIKLGTYPILSLADARKKASSILRDIQLNQYIDPAEAEAAQDKHLTLGDVIPQFIELYAKPRNRDWKGTQSILTKFSTLNDKPIIDIKRSDIVRVMDEIVAGGTPLRANRALAAIKKLFAWCLDRGMVEVHPVAGMKPPAKEVSRDRVLSETELKACWQAAEAENYPFGPYLQLLILTGQRRGEVAGMRWSELDLDKAVWTLPRARTKNKTEHIVPLSGMALDILRALPRFLGSDFVFTTTGQREISGFGRLKRRIEDVVGAKDWRPHDIRRTVATNMAEMEVAPHIIEAVLNHKTGIVSGVAAVYNRHTYAREKREALERWGQRVKEITKATALHRISEAGVAPSSARRLSDRSASL